MTSPSPHRVRRPGLDDELRASLSRSLDELFATTPSGPEVTTSLEEMGWDEVEAEDAAAATSLLFRAQGRALASSSILSATMIGALGPGLRAGSPGSCLLLPHPSEDCAHPRSVHDGRLRGLLPSAPTEGSVVLVPSSEGSRAVVHPVDASWVLSRAVPAHEFDKDSSWLLVDSTDEPPASGSSLAVDWLAATSLGRWAVANEILGVCDGALRLASEHVTSRHQYGRAIGSFQAVRHRLAEAHVAVESASSLLDAVWSGPGQGTWDETPMEWAAAVVKIRAGRAQSEVMRTGVQVLGAMGLTQESPMHRYVARAAALDLLLGGQARLEESLGDWLLDGTTAYPIASI